MAVPATCHRFCVGASVGGVLRPSGGKGQIQQQCQRAQTEGGMQQRRADIDLVVRLLSPSREGLTRGAYVYDLC